MKVVIAGGSGFIGQKLTEILLREGHEIVILTRKHNRSEKKLTYIKWLTEDATPEKEIGRADAFINLAGVSINEGRWTGKHQQQIYHSRMDATEELIRIITALPEKPDVLINASAIGIYPQSQKTVYTDTSMEIAEDFLGQTVRDWEMKASRIKEYGIRAVFMRFGVVLGREEGALPLMVMPYKFFVGGTIGSGEQWVSWIHVTDAARTISFVIENEKISGPVNVTSPSPKTMMEFGKTIGSIIHRPHWFPIPAIIMKIFLGKKSSLVLGGQKVLPEKLLKEGFEFFFPTLESALKDLLSVE